MRSIPARRRGLSCAAAPTAASANDAVAHPPARKCHGCGCRLGPPRFGGATHAMVSTSPSLFQIHGVDAGGKVIVRRQLKRRYVLPFFQKLPPCLIGIEACARAARRAPFAANRASTPRAPWRSPPARAGKDQSAGRAPTRRQGGRAADHAAPAAHVDPRSPGRGGLSVPSLSGWLGATTISNSLVNRLDGVPFELTPSCAAPRKM
jgi:hypothetical protein